MSLFPLKFHIIDVFQDPKQPTALRSGNPLAVVHLPANSPITQDEKQAIASQFNLSETVFLHEPAADKDTTRLTADIFLTTAEIPYAGHPVVGSAWILAKLAKSLNPIGLDVKAGPIEVEYDQSLNYPLPTTTVPQNLHVHEKLLSKEDVQELQPALKDDAPNSAVVVSITKGMTFALVQLPSREALKRVRVSPRSIRELVVLDEDWSPSQVGCLFFFVNQSGSSQNIVKANTRMFMDDLEDAATGSASSALAGAIATGAVPLMQQGYVTEREKMFEWTQGEDMGRPSVLRLSVTVNEQGDKIKKMTLGGACKQVMEGSLDVQQGHF